MARREDYHVKVHFKKLLFAFLLTGVCLDLGLALLALKTLGRAKQASEVISKSEVSSSLSNFTLSL